MEFVSFEEIRLDGTPIPQNEKTPYFCGYDMFQLLLPLNTKYPVNSLDRWRYKPRIMARYLCALLANPNLSTKRKEEIALRYSLEVYCRGAIYSALCDAHSLLMGGE